MKTPLLTMLALTITTTFCHGQGTWEGSIVFANYGGGESWPFFRADGTNRVTAPFVADLQWTLYTGSTLPSDASSLTNFAGFNVPFRTGIGAGYFLGGARELPNVRSDQILARAVVWNPDQAPSFKQAMITPGAEWGFSDMTLVTPDIPPGSPAPLGLGVRPGYILTLNPIPEPSSLALAGLGLAGLLLLRRSR